MAMDQLKACQKAGVVRALAAACARTLEALVLACGQASGVDVCVGW
jgi:hypothetical protein